MKDVNVATAILNMVLEHAVNWEATHEIANQAINQLCLEFGQHNRTAIRQMVDRMRQTGEQLARLHIEEIAILFDNAVHENVPFDES